MQCWEYARALTGATFDATESLSYAGYPGQPWCGEQLRRVLSDAWKEIELFRLLTAVEAQPRNWATMEALCGSGAPEVFSLDETTYRT